jgi:glc operon protein GlcG
LLSSTAPARQSRRWRCGSRDAEHSSPQPCARSGRSARLECAGAALKKKKTLSLEAARKTVSAVEAKADRNHWRGVAAVVDEGCWIILLERMDHAAMTASIELAEGKARSAALFKKPAQALEDAINHGRFAAITARGFIEMQGGLPVVVDGEMIGGIGASFVRSEEDEQVAKEGLAALSERA